MLRTALACLLALVLHAPLLLAAERATIAGLNPDAEAQEGLAGYSGAERAGRTTASGARYDPAALTAAHANLPFGVRLRVTELANGRSVIVTVNDRLPAGTARILDVSQAAGMRLGMKQPGVVKVKTELIGFAPLRRQAAADARARPAPNACGKPGNRQVCVAATKKPQGGPRVAARKATARSTTSASAAGTRPPL